MPLCYCDVCTLWGRRPQGSIQSATTVREHGNSWRASRHRHHTSGLWTDDSRGQTSSRYQPYRGRDPPGHRNTDHELRAVLDSARGRIASFQLPVGIIFAYPPRTAQSFYVTTSQCDSWLVGPSSLDVAAPQNASILEHVRFVQETNIQLQQQLSAHDHASITLGMLRYEISAELARLENFRETMWIKQLEVVSQTTSPLRNEYINNPIVCETSMDPLHRSPSMR